MSLFRVDSVDASRIKVGDWVHVMSDPKKPTGRVVEVGPHGAKVRILEYGSPFPYFCSWDKLLYDGKSITQESH